MIDAHRPAEAGGKGMIVLDGKLVEKPHGVNAERITAKAEGILELERASG